MTFKSKTDESPRSWATTTGPGTSIVDNGDGSYTMAVEASSATDSAVLTQTFNNKEQRSFYMYAYIDPATVSNLTSMLLGLLGDDDAVSPTTKEARIQLLKDGSGAEQYSINVGAQVVSNNLNWSGGMWVGIVVQRNGANGLWTNTAFYSNKATDPGIPGGGQWIKIATVSASANDDMPRNADVWVLCNSWDSPRNAITSDISNIKWGTL